MVTKLHIDIETYCDLDLKAVGVYKYASHPSFEILMIGFSCDDEEKCQLLYPWDYGLLKHMLTNPSIIKVAHNANFERVCLSAVYKVPLPPEQWTCTMATALYNGYPGSLDKIAQLMQLKEQKDPKGKALIRYFSTPCKPTKANGGRTRNLPIPNDNPEKWDQFVEYCRQDVRVEREIHNRLVPLPPYEQRIWCIDQAINDCGVKLNRHMVDNAIDISKAAIAELKQQLRILTGLNNPSSNAQLRQWLLDHGTATPDGLGKEIVPKLMDKSNSDEVKQVLKLHSKASLSSITKYKRMRDMQLDDGRIKGLVQYYGASQTGRWAGRGVQVQNMPRITIEDMDMARQLLMDGDADGLNMIYGDIPKILSQLIRTVFEAEEGKRLVVCDFSAIEARVLAWLSDEKWAVEVFRTHGKIYEQTAANMFGVPRDTIIKGHENYALRQRGKIAVLGLGYGMNASKLQNFAEVYGLKLTNQEADSVVKSWRRANKNIVSLWYEIEERAKEALETTGTVSLKHGVVFRATEKRLWIDLPSGRSICYADPRIEDGQITYSALTQKYGAWLVERTWGSKLAENIVQAIARDCLANSMINLVYNGYKIVMHVHDEVVVEHPETAIKNLETIMSAVIPWAPGLPMKAEGFEGAYYKK